jgi:hypothetical protein
VKGIRAHRRLTVREVSEGTGIPTGSCYTILTEHFGVYLVPVKLVPEHLTEGQRFQRISACKDLQRHDEEVILKKVTTGDETSAYGYNVETK